MTDVKKPQRIDASSYIEIISVKEKQYQKAIRTGEGIVLNSVNDLAYRGAKLSQNEQALQDAIQTPKNPTIQYAITNNVVRSEPSIISLKFVENVYVEEILPQGFGEQVVLDNCQVGTNIYYDGENNTEYSELGWNTYTIDSGGNFIGSQFITGIEPIIYQDIKFGLISTTARNQNNVSLIANPKIEQSYSNIPKGTVDDPPPVNYELNQRISNHLAAKEISISSNNNAYFSFVVQNTTANIAKLTVGVGSNTINLDIRPGARNIIRTSTITGEDIDVFVIAQTIIETAASTALFGVLITQTNITSSEEDKKYDVDIVYVDTSINTYTKITDFSNASVSITNAFRDANKSAFRPPKCTIYRSDVNQIWWIYKRANSRVDAEIFEYNGSTAKWVESRIISVIDQSYDIADAEVIGNTLYVLLNRLIDDNENQLWQRGDLQTGDSKKNIIINYDLDSGSSSTFDLNAISVNSLRKFTPANRANEIFAISDDYIYRLTINNAGQWSVAYKTSTREMFSIPSPNQTKMLFPRIAQYNSGLDVYNTHRLRDVVYDQNKRKLYLSLQSRGTIGFQYEIGMNELDNLPTNAIFIANCDADEILRGEQLTPGPRDQATPNFTTAADLNLINDGLYFSNADRGIIYRFYGLPLNGVVSLPSVTFGTTINRLNIIQNGTLLDHDFNTGLITQFPAGSYSYSNVLTVKNQQSLPEVGITALSPGPRVVLDKRVFVSDFSLCYEIVGGIEDSFCIGEQIEFNGQFNSGLSGWTTTGYVGLDGPSIEMSSNCQGFNEDPTISQIHYSGGPITPLNTIIQQEDKIKLIADIENISTREAEIYTTVNDKTKGFILAPGERRIVASSNFVGTNGIATSSIRVRTYPKQPPILNKRLIIPQINDNWYTYGLFDKSIRLERLNNANEATTGSIRHRYAVVGDFVYTVNGRQINRSNVAFDEPFYIYADNSVVIESLNSAGPDLLYVIRYKTGINQSYYLDIFNTSSKTLVRTYDITIVGDIFGIGNVSRIVSAYNASTNCIIYGSSLSSSALYKLDLDNGNVSLFSNNFNPSLIIRADSITVDPLTGLYYIAVRATTTDYTLLDTLPESLRLFSSRPHIVGLDDFGNIVSQTAIFRGDRPIGGASTGGAIYTTESPLHSLTCLNIDGRQFIAWAKNEPVIRNSTGFKSDTSPEGQTTYGYFDNIGYNKQFFVYAIEYKNTLPAIIANATPVVCLHNKYFNTFSSLTFLG